MHINSRPSIDLIFAALAHPVRLEMVATLATGEKCVCEIAGALGRERSVVSRHLMILEQAGIVQSRSVGRMVIYHLRDKRALNLIDIGIDMVKHPVKEKERQIK
jgi:ArsR family transcriptional regulator|uniref:ArsR family transcriptional regulator n=1 Tax=candidate division WOR-3 bacterium TaxID=2052148 RepID=A0A7V3PSG2_UNCW3